MATIPLAKGYNPAKMQWPAYFSIKYDGVPIRIDFDLYGADVRSRQDKPVPSVTKLIREVHGAMLRGNVPMDLTVVAEVCQRSDLFAPFKDTSGIVRTQEDRSDELILMVFACHSEYGLPYFKDQKAFLEEHFVDLHPQVKVVMNTVVTSAREAEERLTALHEVMPKAEGAVLRSMGDEFKPGKRSWGYQKMLIEPTIDLRVVGFEEAIDQHGRPKGMVGRVVAMYRGEEIGIGPGKLSHKERKELWQDWQDPRKDRDYTRIAVIKYKKDDSYDALRQPTFQHWHLDKVEPDA